MSSDDGAQIRSNVEPADRGGGDPKGSRGIREPIPFFAPR